MITITDLTKRFGARTLFEGVSLQLNAGERYGLVGANGCGKSTFARIIAGDEGQSEGHIAIPKRVRVGVLRQDHFESDEQRILDVAMMGDDVVYQAMREKAAMLDSGSAVDADRLGELEEIILTRDGYGLEARAGEILEGLGIPSVFHTRPLRMLSGGFKLRALLAQVLAAGPDLLVLDEPTNHLDIVSIKWLETFLAGYAGCAVLISHDRRFLDNVCTYVCDVDYETITLYRGDYEAFVVQKVEERARREREIEKQQTEKEHLEAFVQRFKAKASKARQAQSKAKQMEKIVIEDLPQSSRRHPRFQFPQRRPSGREVLEVTGVGKSYGERRVLSGVDLLVRRGERIAIIGENGVGKSTLLKVLVGEVTADTGSTRWGHETWQGYFPQDHAGLIGTEGNVQSWLWGFCSDENIGQIRSRLGAVLFSGDDAEKPLRALSGGECARLIFAKLSAAQPNVLLLDEPTNHLDIEAIEALVDALKTYEGTLIFVSHDRWFVQQLATRIIEIKRDGVTDYMGTYEEYVGRFGDDHLDVEATLQRAKAARAQEAPKEAGKNPREVYEASKKRRRFEAQRDKATAAIADVEQRLARITEAFCRPGYFETTPAPQVQAAQTEQTNLEERLAALMVEWEEAEAKLEELDAASK
ncbi:MAG: ABC-F family ATP-binding cassette domain-containing protein [Myxococcota bacterium]